MKHSNGTPSATSSGVEGTRAQESSFSARLEINDECDAIVGAKEEFVGRERPRLES